VADLRPDHHRATLSSLKELEGHLRSHGRMLSDVILVLQYNHRDDVQENAVEKLHRAVWVEPAAAFESVASEGTGVLGTLTTLSKLIIARLRREADGKSGDPAPAVLAPFEDDEDLIEPAVLAEGTDEVEIPLAMDEGSRRQDDKGFRVESGGPVYGTEGGLRVPFVLIEEGSGRRIELSIRVTLEPQ
jgi:hypothetical protein